MQDRSLRVCDERWQVVVVCCALYWRLLEISNLHFFSTTNMMAHIYISNVFSFSDFQREEANDKQWIVLSFAISENINQNLN